MPTQTKSKININKINNIILMYHESIVNQKLEPLGEQEIRFDTKIYLSKEFAKFNACETKNKPLEKWFNEMRPFMNDDFIWGGIDGLNKILHKKIPKNKFITDNETLSDVRLLYWFNYSFLGFLSENVNHKIPVSRLGNPTLKSLKKTKINYVKIIVTNILSNLNKFLIEKTIEEKEASLGVLEAFEISKSVLKSDVTLEDFKCQLNDHTMFWEDNSVDHNIYWASNKTIIKWFDLNFKNLLN